VTPAPSSSLERIEHIVVLMLEDRSFDHLLGYLSLEGGHDEVDGLRPGMANDHGDTRYPIHHLAATYLPDERWDPEHTAAATDMQINDGAMDGFSGAREKSHRRHVTRRIADAAHLGELLTLTEPRLAPDRSALVDWFAVEQGARARRLLEDPAGTLRPATEHSLTDLQSGLVADHQRLHDDGHPAGHP
jgi:Phosphoesterase family